MIKDSRRKQAAAVLALLLVALLMVALNTHTDSPRCVAPEHCVGRVVMAASAIAAVRQHCSDSDDCVACLLMALGAGHTVICSQVFDAVVRIDREAPVAVRAAIVAGVLNTSPSRAPPA